MDGLHQYTMAGISKFCPKKHEAFFSSLVWKCKNYYYRDKFRRQKCLIIIGHNLKIPALVSRNIISKIFALVKLNLSFIQVYKLRDWPSLLYGRIKRNTFIRIFSPFSKSKIGLAWPRLIQIVQASINCLKLPTWFKLSELVQFIHLLCQKFVVLLMEL